jgi:hypothetical protein
MAHSSSDNGRPLFLFVLDDCCVSLGTSLVSSSSNIEGKKGSNSDRGSIT